MRSPGVALVTALALWSASARAAGPTTRPSAPKPCGKLLYVPPDLEGNVLLYHSFSRGAAKPEVNRLGARVAGAHTGRCVPALTGRGFARSTGKGGGLSFAGLDRPLTKPVTVSLWFRLEKPMADETGFHLISLRANGYISHFVRGKGQWCALKRPTFVVQLYRFPGISNVNGLLGSGRLAEAAWHHVAVAVSEGSRVRVFWNAKLRGEFSAKGRLFATADAVRSIDVGTHWLSHPMTIDEVLILNRALTGADIQAYTTAIRHLAEVSFPFAQ